MIRIKNQELRIKNRNSLGFTLIELLTVIAIIGILTGLLTISFLSVRIRGRDAQRKADIKQIQSALELYRADNDTYPTSSPTSPIATCGGTFASGTTIYMQKIPCDPQTGAAYYYYFGSASAYAIASCLENASDKDAVTAAPAWFTAMGATLPSCNPAVYYISSNP